MRWLVAVLLVAGLAGCVDEAAPDRSESDPAPVLADPLTDGDLAVESLTWATQATIATGRPTQGPVPSGAYVVDMRGTMHIPDKDDAPVALVMHGRHATCRIADMTETLGRVCPDAEPVARPVANAHGYEYLGEHLASHGIFTISVNANNVNDFDNEFSTTGDDYGATARAQIIAHTLRELARANAGQAVDGWPDLSGKLDLARVGLMGHSRGGEGVMAATSLNQEGDLDLGGAVVQAVFALAPTDFDRWRFDTVAFATLLPYCDGDVSNLQGAWAYDDNRRAEHAGLYQFLALGANHNFYNTVWTNDDFGNRGDPWCDVDGEDSGRDSPEEQREHGKMLIGSFFRAHLVGAVELLPLLQGQAEWPIDGINTTFRPGRPGVGTPKPIFRTWLYAEGDHDDDGVFAGELVMQECHGTSCPAERSYSQAAMLRLEWSGSASWGMPESLGEDLRHTLRFIVDPTTDPQALVNSTLEVGGASHSLASLGFDTLPGDSHRKSPLRMLEIPGAGQLTWRFEGTGALQLADGYSYSDYSSR